jgi:hypothetical protein
LILTDVQAEASRGRAKTVAAGAAGAYTPIIKKHADITASVVNHEAIWSYLAAFLFAG